MKMKIGAAAVGGLLLVSPLAAQGLSYWGPLLDEGSGTWPNVQAIHMIHLRGGNILIFGVPGGTRGDPFTQAHVYNAFTGQFHTESQEGQFRVNAALFCSGHALLSDGSALVIGGDAWHPTEHHMGIKDVYRFDYSSLSWSRQADMHEPRWYPTPTLLRDGRMLSTGGHRREIQGEEVDEPEVWQPNAWTLLQPTPLLQLPLYPFMFTFCDPQDPNTEKVFYAGKRLRISGQAAWQTHALKVPPSGSAAEWSPFGNAHPLYGSGAVMWIPQTHPLHAGYVFKFGGPDPDNTMVATKKGAKINLNDGEQAQWTATADMMRARAECNLVALPDGRIAALGGAGVNGPGSTWWENEPVMTAEFYDVETDTWFGETVEMARPRVYHSKALLLPTAAVLTGGGEGQDSAQLLMPYYFMFLGSEPLHIDGTTPTLTMEYDSTLIVQTKAAQIVDQVTLVRLGATTHGLDMNQRFIRMTILNRTDDTIEVYTPKNAGVAPPGDYMLFIVAGRVSMARYMRIQ